jgi:hypothetical protein
MHDPGIDPLSPLAKQIIKAAAYDKLIVNDGAAPNPTLLKGVTSDQLLIVPMKSQVAGFAMLAGLFLRVADLARRHEIASADALNLHRKAEKTSVNVLSVESVGNAKDTEPPQLREVTDTLAF